MCYKLHMLIENYRIKDIYACPISEGWIRARIELSNDISSIFPYLNAILKMPVYNPSAPFLSFNHEGKTIALYPKHIELAWEREGEHRVLESDKEELRKTLNWLVSMINEAWEKRDKIKPISKPKKLGVKDILEFLPGTNCKKCGLPTCFAFAMGIMRGTKTIDQCPELLKPEFKEKRKKLEEKLRFFGIM